MPTLGIWNCQGSQKESCACVSTLIQYTVGFLNTQPLLHFDKKQFPVKFVALSAFEQILSQVSRDPTLIPKLRRTGAEMPIFHCQATSATSCRNLAVSDHHLHPIHTYERSSCGIQPGLLATNRKASDVFATKCLEVHAGGTPLHQGIMYKPRPKCYYTR